MHDLRHTAASLAISRNANPKAVQTMLGHANISITLDRYGHLYEADARGLASALDDAFRGVSQESAPYLPPAEAVRELRGTGTTS